jgi:rubrerythrin
MEEFDSIDEILEFARDREGEANEFYKTLAELAANPAMGELILEFAKEELEHRAKLELEMMKRGKVVREAEKKAGAEEPTGLRLADYGLDDKPQLDLEYEDLLVWAMKKEKASFRLYVDLAAVVRDVEFRETLLSLAEEEAKHKVQLEIEYDEFVAKRK